MTIANQEIARLREQFLKFCGHVDGCRPEACKHCLIEWKAHASIDGHNYEQKGCTCGYAAAVEQSESAQATKDEEIASLRDFNNLNVQLMTNLRRECDDASLKLVAKDEEIARLKAQARDISIWLSEAGIGPGPIPEGVRTLLQRTEKAEADLIALRAVIAQIQEYAVHKDDCELENGGMIVTVYQQEHGESRIHMRTRKPDDPPAKCTCGLADRLQERQT